MSHGMFIGERVFVLKNYGQSTISINRVVFEETMGCEHPVYALDNCSAFTIPAKQTHNLTIKFELGVRAIGKTVQLILFCDKFYYRLELISLLREPANGLNLPATEA